jgi:hypothetical protein
MSPGEIVAEFIRGDFLLHDIFVDFRIGLAKIFAQSNIDLIKQGFSVVLVDGAVLLAD